jgi:ferrous iron transport protein B
VRIISPAGGLAFLTIQMLFIPCLPTLASIRQAAGAWRWVALSVGIHVAVSLTAGWAVYRIVSALT